MRSGRIGDEPISGCGNMYEISQAFHDKYYSLYDGFVEITFVDGEVLRGLFNDEFFEDGSILVSCEVIKIKDIKSMRAVDTLYDDTQGTKA